MTIYPLKSGALSHGTKAWGARFLKPGFSFTEQMDLAFALGFPHLKLFAVGHPDDADPMASYRARWESPAPVVFPERVARSWIKDAPTGWSYRKSGKAPWKVDEPFSDKEIAKSNSPSVQFAEFRMFMFEALESPDPVLERALATLHKNWAEYPDWVAMAWTGVSLGMGAMLLRVPEAVRKHYLDEMAAFAKQVPRDHEYTRFHNGADELLGKSNELRRGRLLHGNATPKEIIATLRSDDVREGWNPDAREAFFGGDEVVDVMRERWREMTADARDQLVEQYGWIRSEAVVRLFLDMQSAPKLKKSVNEWFVDRADYARPILADIEKSKDPLAPSARSTLQLLDKSTNGKQAPSPKQRAAPKKKTAPKKKAAAKTKR